MLSKEESMFAKIAILNNLVSKDQLFAAIREKGTSGKHIGVFLEGEGHLTSEEVDRVMKTQAIVLDVEDEDLQAMREEEINLALSAQRDGYVSTVEMARVLDELGERANDPKVQLVDILMSKELMTEKEIENLKSGEIKITLAEGFEEGEDFIKDTVKDAEAAGLFDEVAEYAGSDAGDPAEITSTRIAPDSTAKEPGKPRVVQKWRLAIQGFQGARKLLKAEVNRTEKRRTEIDGFLVDIKAIQDEMDRVQDNLKLRKMTEVKTEAFQALVKEIKRLENRIVRVLRATRDRGRKSGIAAEKMKKTMHKAYAALRKR